MSLQARLLTLLLFCCAVMTTVVSLGTTSAVAADPDVRARILQKLHTAANPEQGVKSLSDEELTYFKNAMKDMTPTTVVERSGRLNLTTAQRSAMTPTSVEKAAALARTFGAQSVSAGGCWYQYWYVTWKDFSFISTGHTWMQLNWCSNGRTITSWSMPIADGAGDHGNAYHGVNSRNALNVGWEVRQYAKFDFSYGPIHAYPCMQIRGGATGLYSTRKDCNLG
jgi:hypothetical protein